MIYSNALWLQFVGFHEQQALYHTAQLLGTVIGCEDSPVGQ